MKVVNWISALLESMESLQLLFCSSHQVRIQNKLTICNSEETNAGTLNSDFQTLELCEISLGCLQVTQSMVPCYGIPNEIRHDILWQLWRESKIRFL